VLSYYVTILQARIRGIVDWSIDSSRYYHTPITFQDGLERPLLESSYQPSPALLWSRKHV
jgi:hypothetical protein